MMVSLENLMESTSLSVGIVTLAKEVYSILSAPDTKVMSAQQVVENKAGEEVLVQLNTAGKWENP